MKITFVEDHQSRLSGNELYRVGARADLPDADARQLSASGVVRAGWGAIPQTEAQEVPIDYGSHTVAELQSIAKERGIPYSGLRKAELIHALGGG